MNRIHKELIIMNTFKTILLGLLFIFFAQISCENDKENSDYNSIIGKWELLEQPGNCQGGFEKLEITTDSVFRGYYQDTVYFESSFQIEKTKSFDTLFFKNYSNYHKYALINLKNEDSLEFIPPVLTITPTCQTFKRIK
jgi:hypothetical protein